MSHKYVSEILSDHYRKTFREYGATSKGVDWGDKECSAKLRQEVMLEVIKKNNQHSTILDVGCGYGALADAIQEKQLSLSYTGIDIVHEMVREGKRRHPNYSFVCGDILNTDMGKYDYVVCNGILTQKLKTSILEMNEFAQSLVKLMYGICKIGIAFNLMTTYVNFQRDNLYYRNPSEMLSWCMSELTPHVRLNCAYDLWYEYTVYLYKPEIVRKI
uniref:Methyltransferase domain-containing protein n=1 Tax=Candidatus Kentrum sp. LFY TaxID=2126342 RepID=A0A450UPK7_9GAMM|nr:MAG: Methyltransferase domain-containing protein [Candidatus Kentron sp. LFY]